MDTKSTVLISFATPSHYELQSELLQYKYEFADVRLYKPEDIEPSFYMAHEDLFAYKKYFGYFLWKPYFLMKAMSEYPRNDILYVDSNLRIYNMPRFKELLATCLEYVFVPMCHQYPNKDWTKRDTFVYMDADEERYWNYPQAWTVMIGVNGFSLDVIKFLAKYLRYCADERIVTELPNVCGLPNLPGFVAHRWEQSIFSILCEKAGIEGIPFPEFNGVIDKVYPKEIVELKEQIERNPLQKNE